MEAERLSPFTKQRWGVRMAALLPRSRLPSIRAKSGRCDRPSIASCMAFIRALRISVSSISFSVTKDTDQASALSWMTGKRASRFFSDSFLESFSPGIFSPSGRITAAAYTGPARGPAPASSQPQTAEYPSAIASFSYCQKSMVMSPSSGPRTNATKNRNCSAVRRSPSAGFPPQIRESASHRKTSPVAF